MLAGLDALLTARHVAIDDLLPARRIPAAARARRHRGDVPGGRAGVAGLPSEQRSCAWRDNGRITPSLDAIARIAQAQPEDHDSLLSVLDALLTRTRVHALAGDAG